MKLLITGCKGQLGTELVRQAGSNEIIPVDHDELDITDATAVASFVIGNRPDVIINAAAYTAVDQAETDRDLAFAVNRDGPANLAKGCAGLNIPLIHISTDYVFNGTKSGAYTEDDPIDPLGVYGESKAAGEEVVRSRCSRHIILRTSWVFSAHGNNFVKTMLRLGAERSELGVVADQKGCPTSAHELARVIYTVLDHDAAWGTYHCVQPEPTTWHGFARAIFDEARQQGMKLAVNVVKPIETSDYPTAAARPENSVLYCNRIRESFAIKIKPWRESLAEAIKELKAGSDL